MYLPILFTIDDVGAFEKLFLVLARLANGWIQSFTILPYLLLAHTFRPDNIDDKCVIHLWFGFGTIGEEFGLLALQVMICVEFSWLGSILLF